MKKRETTVRAGTSRRRAWLLSLVACVCLVMTLAAALSRTFVCYAVSYEGTVVGTVSTRTELNAALEEADALAGELLGEEHPIYGSVAVTTTLSSGAGDAQTLAGALLENVEGIRYLPVLTVDGVPVAAPESPEALSAILEGILARYTTENTVSAAFTQKIEVEPAFAGPDLPRETEEIARLLDPENAQSPCRLTVVTRESAQETETIPFEVEITYDSEAYSDQRRVAQEGRDGERLVTYVTVFENGSAVTRYLAESHIVTKPVAEQDVVGSIPGSRTDSTGTYIWPTTGLITSDFGWREISNGSSNHRGVDIGNSVGTEVYAADGGEVIYAQDSRGNYGNFIKIRHDNGTVTCYAHLSQILVSVGDKVAQGDQIALMGKTGRVTGPHLHFEIRPDGETPADPAKYLSGKPER